MSINGNMSCNPGGLESLYFPSRSTKPRSYGLTILIDVNKIKITNRAAKAGTRIINISFRSLPLKGIGQLP